MRQSQFLIDKQVSASTAAEVPAFPWVQADAGLFIWEEALYDGAYCAVHYSAMGRSQSKENIYQKLTCGRFPSDHLLAFELEVDGEKLRDGFHWQRDEIRRMAAGCEEMVVTLTHDRYPLEIGVHTLLDGTAFLVRWLTIQNTGQKAHCLAHVYPWAGIIACEEAGTTIITRDTSPPFMLGHYRHGHWAMEGDFGWMTLADGTYSVRTLRNKYHPPFFVVQNRRTGELTVIHIECTAHIAIEFTQAVELTHDLPRCPWGGRYLYTKAGLGGRAPLRVLQPGETATTPAIHLSVLHGDLDAGVNALHEHLRTSVIPAQPNGRAHFVEYNHTGYTQNAQISREGLRQEVEMAAALGIELFVVDAGWYGPKDKSWGQCVGDWVENPLLGEGGLKGIFNYARSKGMKCGLWLPPEWVAQESPVARAHPDWFIPGSTTFDLLNPVVEDYVVSTVCHAVEHFELDCLRIDGGTSGVGERLTAQGQREDLAWRYYDTLYRIYERVRQRFPHLILENCSGGGGRSDLGMLRRFHYTQISDNWDPACQIRILNGMTLALTPCQCMPLVGSINMRSADIDFVIRTALFGHFTASGVFPKLERANLPALERWKHGIALYKREVRPMLSSCRVYHHTPTQDYSCPGDWVVLEYASADRATVIVGIFRLAGSVSETYTVIARGVDAARDYVMYADNDGTSTRVAGQHLASVGIAVRVAAPLMSELLIMKAVGEGDVGEPEPGR